MRWMNRLATALLVLAVVAGPPLLAAAWLQHYGWPAPTRAQIVAWAAQPLTAGTIIAGCVAVAALAWLLLLIHLTRRALTGLRRRLRRMRHLPMPTPAQMTASSMAGFAAFTLPAAPTGDLQPLPAATGTPQLSDPPVSDHRADRPAQGQPPGVTLPGGGWIPYRTAAAITALAAGVWLQRRRGYRPDPYRPRDHSDDSDLQPLPDAVHTITHATTDHRATGPDHRSPSLLAAPLPEGILQLTGPGAAAAARGLLIIAAVSDTAAVSVRPDDLHLLLPATHPADPAATHVTAEPRPTSGTRTVIVLGDDPAATHRWHVTTDGTATGTGLTEPRRLCTLDPQTTTDLLILTGMEHRSVPVDPQPTSALVPPTVHVSEPATDTATAAHLTLFGGCHLTLAGEPVHLRRTAGLQILAYLAVHPEGARSSDLVHALWPHLPAAAISQRLHTTLADLRRQLRPLLEDDPITRHDNRYQLNTRAITTDLQRWRTSIRTMTHSIGTTAQHHACRDVVALYRGELAADHTWSWLTPAREQTRRTVIDACSALADHTDPDEALRWLQHAIAIDPYNEPLHHHAADLLHAAGDTTGAAELIKRLHRRLADEVLKPI
jgi:DNA-binding SARP family transcriptional activator